MGIGEDEIRHEDANSAAEGAAASQTAAATDVAAASGGATKEPSADLPTSQAPNRERGDAGAKPKGVAATRRVKSIAAKAMPILAGKRLGRRSKENQPAVRPRPRAFRFASRAATIALAAGAGSFLGALTAGGLAHHPPEPAAAAGTEGNYASETLKAQLATLSALKASIDRVNRSANAQFAKIGQRFDSLEQAQAGSAARLAHAADALERLEKQRVAAADATGSINPPSKPSAPGQGAAAAEANPPSKTSAPSGRTGASDVTGSIAAKPAPVLRSWIIDDVRNGRAMVESRYGDVFVVGAGSVLPGLGRVEQIERQDGRWVVVTANGLITSPR